MTVNHIPIVILAGIFASGCADMPEQIDALKECTDSSSPYICHADSLCCRGQCVVISEENCGICGNACKANEICAQLPTREWACVCGSSHNQCSLTCCSDGCVEISTNSRHCGQCEHACPEGQICSLGKCQCTGQLTQCSSACVDLSSDPQNCGQCGLACPNADDLSLHLNYSSCINASCSFGCIDGYRDMDGIKDNGCETPIYVCGNGMLDPNEDCDQNAFGYQNCQTVMGTGYAGTLKCHENCTFDTSSCINTTDTPTETSECGNAKAEDGEVCDLTDLRQHTCEELLGEGYTGTLKCSSDCRTFETENCTAPTSEPICGNGELEGSESCDKSVFLHDIKSCASYDSRYLSGNLTCTSDCQISTSDCSECVYGSIECEDQVLKKCTGKTWEITECKGNTPICSIESGKCIAQPSIQTVYNTDFEWLPDAVSSDSSYTKSYIMPDTVNFELTATGRIYLFNSSISYAIDGKGIILRTDDKPDSGIKASGLTKGIGTIEFDVYGWDAGKVYIEYGSSGCTSEQNAPQKTRTHVSFVIDSATDTNFTIKSKKRVTVDNLSWTSVN